MNINIFNKYFVFFDNIHTLLYIHVIDTTSVFIYTNFKKAVR